MMMATAASVTTATATATAKWPSESFRSSWGQTEIGSNSNSLNWSNMQILILIHATIIIFSEYRPTLASLNLNQFDSIQFNPIIRINSAWVPVCLGLVIQTPTAASGLAPPGYIQLGNTGDTYNSSWSHNDLSNDRNDDLRLNLTHRANDDHRVMNKRNGWW